MKAIHLIHFTLIIFFLISSCSKKIAKREEVFDPEKFIAKAEKLISDKEYEEARKLLIEVKNRDTTKKYAPLAHLKIADSYIKEEELDRGIEEYRRFTELYPDNRFASYAQYQIAMSYFNQIESPDKGSGTAQKALKEFLILKERYPRNPYKETVELRIEKCRNVIADGEFYVGEFYYKKGSFNAAIKRFLGLFESFPEYRRNDEVLFLIGKSYEGLKQKDQAKKYFKILVERYPHSKFVTEAKRRSH
ncbi:MAG: outer membrane protein assembly factor BamD [Thermodesulfovibrionales bacterium]|nr:outer membrane protein assembly factor BamD [Thermodesulfovibrionales bacterium]